MIELPLVFVAGVLGTAHCLGMCGPLALAIGGAAPNWTSALARQLAYTCGRVFTYGVLGATAGFCGARLARSLPAVVNVPALLAVAAGLFLVYQGLRATGSWPRLTKLFARVRGKAPLATARASAASCLGGGWLAPFWRQPGASGVFLAGLFTGLLPCGLLYGMLALAASSHSVVTGGIVMVVFGLGTAPAMMAAGVGGRLMSLATRRWLYAAAAWCLVLTGVVSVARGFSFLSFGHEPAAGCPLCAPAATVRK